VSRQPEDAYEWLHRFRAEGSAGLASVRIRRRSTVVRIAVRDLVERNRNK